MNGIFFVSCFFFFVFWFNVLDRVRVRVGINELIL